MKVKPQFVRRADQITKEQAERLMTLAYFLKTEVSEDQFDMDEYIQIKTGENPLLSECGTSACALGWCTVVFPNHFYACPLEDTECTYSEDTLIFSVLGTDGDEVSYHSDYVTEFFGLSYEEAIDLFGKEKSTPKAKAKQIEELVRTRGYTYA